MDEGAVKEQNRQGEIPDGSMIVKEMYNPPAIAEAPLASWTVMVKDKNGSWDGWFWDYFGANSAPDPTQPPTSIDTGFGTYCIRCHAAAVSQSTFSSVRNVEADPVTYRVTVPSMLPEEETELVPGIHERVEALTHVRSSPPAVPAEFSFPDEDYYDKVVSGPGGPGQFLPSGQCLGCHSASLTDMAYLFPDPRQLPINLSPYTEWHRP